MTGTSAEPGQHALRGDGGAQTPEDDDVLVRRVQAGEVSAFRSLVERHHPACTRYARAMLGNSADAADVVQETFWRAWNALGTYTERGSLARWLFTILANQCRNALAARTRRERPLAPLESAEQVPAMNTAPLDDFTEIGHVVAALSPPEREVLLLRFGEGLEYSEIAIVTGASVSALKMRARRAIERLRHDLGRRAGREGQ